MLTRTKFDNALNALRSLQEEVIEISIAFFPEKLSTFILKLHRCDDAICYDATYIDEQGKKWAKNIFKNLGNHCLR